MGHTYTIKYQPESMMKNLCGETVFEGRIIRIRENMSEPEIESTLLHEVIHAVLSESGVTYLMSTKMDEAITRAIESGLAPLVTFRVPRKARNAT